MVLKAVFLLQEKLRGQANVAERGGFLCFQVEVFKVAFDIGNAQAEHDAACRRPGQVESNALVVDGALVDALDADLLVPFEIVKRKPQASGIGLLGPHQCQCRVANHAG